VICFVDPDDEGKRRVNIGVSIDDSVEDGTIHFTGEGTVGAGGRLEGASRDIERLNTAGAKCGGIRKCNVSSLVEYI
jgi:hypothetical protein